MAGLTGRMSTVVKAKVSKLLDRAEDPAETLDYSYQKQVEQLQNVKKGIADVVTAKKRLQMQETSLQQAVVKLDTQARQALSSGQEDLARTALERKNVAQTELQSLDTQVNELEGQQEKLRELLRLMAEDLKLSADLRNEDFGRIYYPDAIAQEQRVRHLEQAQRLRQLTGQGTPTANANAPLELGLWPPRPTP